MHKKIRLCRLGRNWFSHPGQGKGGPCDLQENANRVKNFHPTHPPGGSKTLSSAFQKYEIHKGRHFYRTHKKAVYVHQFTRRLKKILILLQKINQSPVRRPRFNGGAGTKCFFPNKRYRCTLHKWEISQVQVSIFLRNLPVLKGG